VGAVWFIYKYANADDGFWKEFTKVGVKKEI
jgi:hypothetical protein